MIKKIKNSKMFANLEKIMNFKTVHDLKIFIRFLIKKGIKKEKQQNRVRKTPKNPAY